MSYPVAEHDRMIAAMLMPCRVVGVDLPGGMVRVQAGEWTSAWVRWHSQAAGKARHWRAPSLGEQGVLLSPSGVAGMGTFIPGLYGNAGAQPDNRDHVEVWRFDDGGSLVYDWQANTYTIDLPAGTVTIKVGASLFEVTPEQVRVAAGQIVLVGTVTVDGTLSTTGDINSAGKVIDAGGNTPNHKH
ncbi:phage baseplate assembly protein V [Pseudomonas sp. ok272]|uniref:phage baseplate assembly protein V n=1 Tax=unclassified Pseudomonas TaxID=196821 RepID=UPI0008D1BE46|nr:MULTISPECIES: phage baseplate assembly protein V [unclassified Pseudomonas]SEN18877.1 phage baseplate assembly protein V [Pseudomonas sp. ok272]SFN10889.1 phage baseplate assembly protein V [Pseudomonas sp. ok602]